jgi:DNA-binding MarR family transcriptional regulator
LKRSASTALLALWEQEGFTQTELADRLKITPATVTKMLQRMEKTGFIQRKPDAKDQRASRVYLTKAGRAIQDDVEVVWKTMEAET